MYIGSSTKKEFVSFDVFICGTKCSSSATVVTSVMRIPLPLEVGEQFEEYFHCSQRSPSNITWRHFFDDASRVHCEKKLQSYGAGQFWVETSFHCLGRLEVHPANSPSPYLSPSPNSYHFAMPFQTPFIPNPYVQHPGAYGFPFQMPPQPFQGFHHAGAFLPNPTPSANPSFAFDSNPNFLNCE